MSQSVPQRLPVKSAAADLLQFQVFGGFKFLVLLVDDVVVAFSLSVPPSDMPIHCRRSGRVHMHVISVGLLRTPVVLLRKVAVPNVLFDERVLLSHLLDLQFASSRSVLDGTPEHR
ncbi:hypothetical protein MRX96_009714 [Rhipicephalus microplus]